MSETQDAKWRYLYGPVPSRRLGQSLGVDPISFKVCNYNCVYCQLGRTRPLTCQPSEKVDIAILRDELADALGEGQADQIDYVTVVGEGEPTLCINLGEVVAAVKEITTLPVAVITNGALLSDPAVREALGPADVLLPTLDAADQDTYRRINRPCGRLRVTDIIEGMIAYRRDYSGRLWPEVMLVEGLNDGEAQLQRLAEAFDLIGPDQVHVNVPVRPPAEPWVRIPKPAALKRAVAILGQTAQIVISDAGAFQFAELEGLAEKVLSIVRRHPMRQRNLEAALPAVAGDALDCELESLVKRGLLRRVTYDGESFWQASQVYQVPDGDERGDA